VEKRAAGTWAVGLLLLRGPLGDGCGVGSHRGADELFEGGLVDLPSFAEVDCASCAAFQAGVEEPLRVIEGGAAGEGEFDHLLVEL